MSIIGAVIGTLGTLLTYFILIALLQKMFSIGKDMTKIREILEEFKREQDASAVIRGAHASVERPEWSENVAALRAGVVSRE